MPVDTLYRHQQALDPSALTIVTGAIHAVAAALDDCRAAGKDPDTDAAIILLARHLGRIAERLPIRDDVLRRRCVETIAVIGNQPFGLPRTRRRTAVRPDEHPLAA